MFSHFALNTIQKTDEGYIGVESKNTLLVGKEGIAHTVLRPSGMVEIDGDIYDAMSSLGFIEKGTKVKVTSYETGQIHVEKV